MDITRVIGFQSRVSTKWGHHLLIEQGENIKYIQAQLGHASPMVTLTVYAHLMKPVNQESACKLENTIFSTTGGKMVAEIKKGFTAKAINP